MGKGFYVRRRVDLEQAAIVAVLRQVGASVQHLHTIGHGCPDLLVAFQGNMWLMEVKTGKAGLTDDEAEWGLRWNAPVHVVHNAEEALLLIGLTL